MQNECLCRQLEDEEFGLLRQCKIHTGSSVGERSCSFVGFERGLGDLGGRGEGSPSSRR